MPTVAVTLRVTEYGLSRLAFRLVGSGERISLLHHAEACCLQFAIPLQEQPTILLILQTPSVRRWPS